MIISIEGNIGSGKSTFVEYLRNTMSGVIFLQEPVAEWNGIKDNGGETILSKFYRDQTKYAFPFQMMAYISRLALLKKTVEENPGKVIITERCLDTDRFVFAKMMYDQGKMEEVEYQIYLKWFHCFQCEYPISYYIYLNTTPETAHERVLKRNREGETIGLDYLRECAKYHNKWLDQPAFVGKIVSLNANVGEHQMSKWVGIIEDLIKRF
jgi:deoxyadenosine/deoxycytidine kinase